MMPPNQYGYKQMRVVRMLVQLTGTYGQQFLRPYQSNMTQQSKNEIMEHVDRARSIVPTAIAGFSSQFISPSATPESAIQIVGGWQEQRLRFMLQIDTQDTTGMNTTTEFITGYTDHKGLSLQSNLLDPNMLFIVNDVNTTRKTLAVTPMGNQTHYNHCDSSHILINDTYSGLMAPRQTYGLRPEDVFDQIDSNELAQNVGGDMFVHEARNLLTKNATKSDRKNAVAPVYVANVLDAWLQSTKQERDQPTSQVMATAREVVASTPILQDPFMTYLRHRSGMMSTKSFTLQDLINIDSNSPNVVKFVPIGQIESAGLHQAGMSQNWGGSDYTTVVATSVGQTVPSYLSMCGLSNISFSADNLSQGGEANINIMAPPKSLSLGMDLVMPMQNFIFKLKTELLRTLSQSNMISYALEVKCDVLGETWINVSLNGQPAELFVFPTFTDALLAPVTTTNNAILGSIAGDFSELMNEITENMGSKMNIGSAQYQTGII